MALRLAALLLLSTVAQAQFTLHTNHLKWSQARAFCQRQQGDLASIHSRAEQVTVAKLAGRYSVWIGFNDRVTEGQWKWSDGTPSDFTHWNRGEPNNAGNEDYAEMLPKRYGGRWNDNQDRPLPFICRSKGAFNDRVTGCRSAGKVGGGTAPAGTPCDFPFTYKGRSYSSCTPIDNGIKPWCYTKHSDGKSKLWGNCVCGGTAGLGAMHVLDHRRGCPAKAKPMSKLISKKFKVGEVSTVVVHGNMIRRLKGRSDLHLYVDGHKRDVSLTFSSSVQWEDASVFWTVSGSPPLNIIIYLVLRIWSLTVVAD